MERKAIKFREDRTFGDLIGAPFQFVFQEFKNLFGSILKYSGPFLLVGLIFLLLSVRKSYGTLFPDDSVSFLMVFSRKKGSFSIRSTSRSSPMSYSRRILVSLLRREVMEYSEKSYSEYFRMVS